MKRLFAVVLVLFFGALLGAGLGCDSAGGAGGDDAGSLSDAVSQEVAGADGEAPGDGLETDLSPEELYPGDPGATGIFELERQSFYDQPFPCNTRLRANGRPNLSDFPNPQGLPILKEYIQLAELRLDGFSNNGAVYFRFDGPLAEVYLPTVFETASVGSSVLLVNVTEGSDHYGEQLPVELWWWDREAPGEDYYLQPRTLAVRPLGGFPMRPGETYACVVTRRLKDAQGRHLGVNAVVGNALSSDPGAPLRTLFAPLRKWLEATPGIAVHDVAIATVFVVQDPVREMVQAADFLRNEFVPELTKPLEAKPTGGNYLLFEGRYMAPNLQTGDPPYETDGEIVFDAAGKPKVQWMEEITFALTLPVDSPMPAAGWPIVMYSHGTGGNYKSFLGATAKRFAEQGIAMIGIDQPLHGARYHGPDINTEFYSFNFTNPWGARSLFRQAGLDFVVLTRLVQDLTFSSSGKMVRFDSDKVGYFGHSQGGLTGALFLAVAEDLRASVLSGAGGGLSYTILLRKQLDSGTSFDIKAALEGILMLEYEDEMTLFHPVLTLVQTLVEATDPINYSPYYLSPRFVERPVNVIITSGVEDPYTPAVTTDNLAIAGSIPPVAPQVHDHPGFDLRDLEPLKPPVKANLQAADGLLSTAVLTQFADQGHFVAFDDANCIAYYMTFFASAFGGSGPPVVDK
jgi:hypothetical protein